MYYRQREGYKAKSTICFYDDNDDDNDNDDNDNDDDDNIIIIISFLIIKPR